MARLEKLAVLLSSLFLLSYAVAGCAPDADPAPDKPETEGSRAGFSGQMGV